MEAKNEELRSAILGRNPFAVFRLLREGADPNDTDGVGFSAVHYAITYKNPEMLPVLKMFGADFEKRATYFGFKPLHLIALSNNHDAVTKPDQVLNNMEKSLMALMKCGVEIGSLDLVGNSLLHLMFRGFPDDVNFIIKLISLGLEPSATNAIGNNCLHLLASHNNLKKRDVLHLAGLFLKKGVDINATNNSGQTALHIATRHEKLSLSDFLLRKGADLTAKDRDGMSPFDQSMLISNKMCGIFVKHIILRKHRGLTVDKRVMEKIQSDDILTIFHDAYKFQIENLKTLKISQDYKVTYYDFLCRSKFKVAKYLRNAEIRKDFCFDYELSAAFTEEINIKFEEALEIVNSEDQAFVTLNEILGRNLPKTFLEDLSSYVAPEYRRRSEQEHL